MSQNHADDRLAADGNAPDYIVWYVAGGNRYGKKSFWTRIGAAWKHRDGEGLNLQLDLLPAGNGRVVLRAPKAEVPAEAADASQSA